MSNRRVPSHWIWRLCCALLLVTLVRCGEEPTSPKPVPSHSETPSPDASRSVVPRDPSPDSSQQSVGVSGSKRIWSGPDEAVASWTSKACGREVLAYGTQQYERLAEVSSVPEGTQDLGYRDGKSELWGDLGAPRTLYVKTDAAKFEEWAAVPDECPP